MTPTQLEQSGQIHLLFTIKPVVCRCIVSKFFATQMCRKFFFVYSAILRKRMTTIKAIRYIRRKYFKPVLQVQ